MTLPQPPPDLPPPTWPRAQAIDSRIKAKRIGWLGGISMAFCACVLLAPVILGSRGKRPADRTEALNNMKQVSTMLFEFDNEYGQFPDASTIAAVKAKTKTTLTLGSASSNQLFRQILAGGAPVSEKPFWAKTAISSKKPDDIFSSDATALAKGECGFAYIAGLTASGDPDAPVLLCPLIPGKREFDAKAFKGKALILRLDSSATVHPIDSKGHVLLGGKDLFDPTQPFWHGKAPDIKWPE